MIWERPVSRKRALAYMAAAGLTMIRAAGAARHYPHWRNSGDTIEVEGAGVCG